MEPVAEAMMTFVVTLAAASYCHFGVTLKDGPALHQHAQRTHQTVQRIPVTTVVPPSPQGAQTVAERTVVVRSV